MVVILAIMIEMEITSEIIIITATVLGQLDLVINDRVVVVHHQHGHHVLTIIHMVMTSNAHEQIILGLQM